MKRSERLQSFLNNRAWDALWFLFFLLLPITSMPAVVRIVRSDVVAAPSGILLLLLLLGWVLPVAFSGGKLSKNFLPLIGFVLVSLICTALSFFLPIPLYKHANPFSAAVSASLTLFVGFAFLLAAMFRAQQEHWRTLALRAINLSGAIVLGWTLLQAFFWFTTKRYPDWMKSIQFFLSVGPLYRQRFVGFALEPSWLAHQLNLLYLPYWFACSVTGYSVFCWKKAGLTVERILFFFGSIVLYLTLSRVGVAAFLLTVIFFILKWGWRRAKAGGLPQRKIVLRVMLFLLLLPAALLLILWTLTKLDFRMAQLFSIQFLGRSDPLMYLAQQLSLASRFVYWEAGFRIFADYPIFGVGLGHAGFYLPQHLSAFALQLFEVRDLLLRSDTLLNIKSLWVRVPAETGIVGLSFFIVWLLSGWNVSRGLMRRAAPIHQTIGWMAAFTLVAFLIEGWSVDTFALPYLWVSLGLAGGVLAQAEQAEP